MTDTPTLPNPGPMTHWIAASIADDSQLQVGFAISSPGTEVPAFATNEGSTMLKADGSKYDATKYPELDKVLTRMGFESGQLPDFSKLPIGPGGPEHWTRTAKGALPE